MKKHIYFLVPLVFFITISFAQSNSHYATMVVNQSASGVGLKSKMVITRGEGNSEQIDIKDMSKWENVIANNETIIQQMNKLKEEGYKLITSNASTTSQYVQFTTYVFYKD